MNWRDWLTKARRWFKGAPQAEHPERGLSTVPRARRVGDTWLDRVIVWVAPAWAAQRKIARFALDAAERFVGYREGRPSRIDAQVHARGASADWALELGFDRREIVDRARQLERDNALACTMLDRSVEHVVGEGFQLKVRTKDEGWNRAAEQLWQDWCAKGCDSRGMMTFSEMLATIFRSWLRDGDVAAVLESDGAVRLVESDEIASPVGGYSQPSDADGVELDRRGRIKAFYVFDYDPTVLWPDRRRATPRLVRVPAESVIFLSRRQRAGQTRGISAFSGITWLLDQLDDTVEAVAVAHRMAACFGLFLKKKSPLSGATTTSDSRGEERPELAFEPGMVLRLDPDEEAGQIAPVHPSGMFETLMRALIRFAGSRFGLPLEVVNYDFSQSNYSNARAASLECSLSKRGKQKMLKGVCTDFWAFRLARAIREGDLTPRRDAGAHQWDVPGTPWIDPQVEVQAAQAAIDGGLDTRTKVLARRGLDFEETARELAAEKKLMDELGLPEVRGSLTRDPVVAGSKPAAPKS
jgi:lambda family phage portal protein